LGESIRAPVDLHSVRPHRLVSSEARSKLTAEVIDSVHVLACEKSGSRRAQAGRPVAFLAPANAWHFLVSAQYLDRLGSNRL